MWRISSFWTTEFIYFASILKGRYNHCMFPVHFLFVSLCSQKGKLHIVSVRVTSCSLTPKACFFPEFFIQHILHAPLFINQAEIKWILEDSCSFIYKHYSSGSKMLASQHGVLGSVLADFMVNFWWTVWHWSKSSFVFLLFSLSIILPLLHANLSLLPKVCDSHDQAAADHIHSL